MTQQICNYCWLLFLSWVSPLVLNLNTSFKDRWQVLGHNIFLFGLSCVRLIPVFFLMVWKHNVSFQFSSRALPSHSMWMKKGLWTPGHNWPSGQQSNSYIYIYIFTFHFPGLKLLYFLLRWEAAGSSYFLALHRFSLQPVTESESIPASWTRWMNSSLDIGVSLIFSLSGHGLICDQWNRRRWCWLHWLGLFSSPPLLGQDSLRFIFSPLSNLVANCSNSGASPTSFGIIFHSLTRFQHLEVYPVIQPKLSST